MLEVSILKALIWNNKNKQMFKKHDLGAMAHTASSSLSQSRQSLKLDKLYKEPSSYSKEPESHILTHIKPSQNL